eukprot:1198210-Pyramimonas_sp.AAC.1
MRHFATEGLHSTLIVLRLPARRHGALGEGEAQRAQVCSNPLFRNTPSEARLAPGDMVRSVRARRSALKSTPRSPAARASPASFAATAARPSPGCEESASSRTFPRCRIADRHRIVLRRSWRGAGGEG